MSKPPKNTPRHASDFYETPAWVVHEMIRIARHVLPMIPKSVLEPGCGPEAPFLKSAATAWPLAWLAGVEYLPQPAGPLVAYRQPVLHFNQDYMTRQSTQRFDLIITNPPFSLAQEFLAASRKHLAPGGKIVFLLPLTWLACRKRWEAIYKISDNRPESVHVLVVRPSFTGEGTNATEYGIFVWGEGCNIGATKVCWVPPRAKP